MSITKDQIRKIIFDHIQDYPVFENDNFDRLELAIRDLSYFNEDNEESFENLLKDYFDHLKKVNDMQFSLRDNHQKKISFDNEPSESLKGSCWFFSYTEIPKILLQGKYGADYSKYSYQFFKGPEEY